MKLIQYNILLFLFSTTSFLFAQACCTAGTPLLSALEMSTTSRGVLSLRFSTKYNSLRDVYSGSDFLENQERERISYSFLFEINYGISNRLSFSALFSFMRQTRKVQTIVNFENTINVSGIGDALFLVKYNLINMNLFKRIELALGAGAKLPFGTATVEANNVLLPADMQPGTGSFDGLLWIYFAKGDIFSPQLTFVANSSYRLNGTNKRFGLDQAGYKFGNEFILTSGIAYITDTFFDLTLLARYRNTSQDQFSIGTIPNTGGDWIYVLPGINFNISKSLITSLIGEIPIYQNVIGTQLTTTFSISLSMNYSINTIKNLGF
jgi:hypothetical protein